MGEGLRLGGLGGLRRDGRHDGFGYALRWTDCGLDWIGDSEDAERGELRSR
jgi:hypothetical protein